jgi:CNT family concentrative nucleoside transporter
MAAPGGLLMAKLMIPETTERTGKFDPEDLGDVEQPVNIFEAIGNGATTGMQVALSVGALLIAFVAFVALINGALSGVGNWFGIEGLTLQWLLGKLFMPIALVIGVPWAEAAEAGSLIGQKLVINEFYAYLSFVEIKDTLSAHTQLIVTFALCGFANLSSIAILMGGLGAIVPSRRHDIARLGLKAVIGGTLVNLMNASLAGLIFALHGA